MPFRTLMRYRNPDITSDLNHRLRDLVQKGVFSGGDVIPIAGQLNVQVGNLAAVGADGMVTLLEGVPETVSVQAGFAQWVLLRAVYVANDDPVAQLEVLTETAYTALTDAEKDERIKLAKVTLSVTATEVTTDDISFTEADRIDPVQRSQYRGSVATEADLPDFPSLTSLTNRVNDVYFIEDDRVFASWTMSGWRLVVGTTEAIELNDHKNNEDDGTVAPDFYNAQHVLLKHRQSLDAETASVAQFGANGSDFGATNPLVDADYPLTAVRRVDFTGLAAATTVQLTGTYYVGTGVLGTATGYFRLSVYGQNKQLVGSDRRPITVLRVLTSDAIAELDPGSDADALGFYDDPIVVLDMTVTTDATYTGNLSVFASVKRTAGTRQFADASIADNGLGFVPLADSISVVGANFGEISTAIDDVQQALEAIDSELGAQAALDQDVKDAIARIQNGAVYTANPDALSWYGGTGSAVGLLDDDASNNPRLRAVTTDLIFQVPTARQFNWVVNTATEMSLTASLLQLTSSLNVGGSVAGGVGDGIFTRGLNVGSDEAPTDNDIYARGGGINCGGSTGPTTGDGIFTGGIHVGTDTQPSDSRVSVGDTSKLFGLDWDGTDGALWFDQNDMLRYDRSANDFLFEIDGTTEMLVSTDGLRVLNGVHVGSTTTAPEDNNLTADGDVKATAFVFGIGASDDKIEFNDTSNEMSFRIDNGVELIITPAAIDFQANNIIDVAGVGCTSVTATSYLEAPTWRADANNTATWVAGTSLTWTVASGDRAVLTASGLQVAAGLHVGDTTATPLDDDITLTGGIRCGGTTTDPGVGDGIFTGGLRIGSDAIATPGDIIASGGITAGGVTNPGTGDGIFSNALRIGGDSAPATKLQLFTSAVGVFASNSDIVVEKDGDSFLNFMVSGEGGILVGDATDSDIGRLIYVHSSDSWQMYASNQNALEVSSSSMVAAVGQTAVGDSAAVDATAALKVQSTTRGFLPPVMTTTEKNNISTPTVGLMVFDSVLNALQLYDGTWKSVTVT
jgi:hypothetical protein